MHKKRHVVRLTQEQSAANSKRSSVAPGHTPASCFTGASCSTRPTLMEPTHGPTSGSRMLLGFQPLRWHESADAFARRGVLGFDELRAPERLARAGSHRTPQKARVRPGDAALGRGTLPTSRERIRVVFRITSQLIRLRPSTRTLRWSLPATSWPEGSSFAITPRCTARVAEHGGDRDISVLVRQCLKRRLPDTRDTRAGGTSSWCVWSAIG